MYERYIVPKSVEEELIVPLGKSCQKAECIVQSAEQPASL